MDKVYTFGVPDSGESSIRWAKEIRRLKLAFECGPNSIIVSPRGIGAISLVKQVISELKDNSEIIAIYINIFDCQSEYDLYKRFATAIIKQSEETASQWIENTKDFLAQESTCYSGSILNWPELLAKKLGRHIIVCIDEFQMIGQMNDAITIQKRLRKVWQHQEKCSYCLIGYNESIMKNMFQNSNMPFYLFGDMHY